MGCGNCSNGSTPRGCKSNGSCGTTGCNKLEVFDWLADIEMPNGQSPYDILEVRFKNSRKGFYRNIGGLDLHVGDAVVVESSPGHDVGVVSVTGELARIQVRKKAPNLKAHEARKVYRIAGSEDIDKWKAVREQELPTMFKARELANRLGLDMKISDVEYQGDGNKATFFYTAEDRVDFRQLIRDMADTFKTRIEMKQIGMRQEAARLGGIGSCGRELCCSTWLTDFRSVSTASARYQQLSLNPQKLAGQCGKLKCCLNFELDVYVEALKKFPKADTKLKTEKGIAIHVKTDVFKEEMWYLLKEEGEFSSGTFIPLSPDRVKEIIKMNKEGKKPADLKDYMIEVQEEKLPDYTNVVGQDSLNRFEHIFKRSKKKSKKGGQKSQQKEATNKQNDKKQAPQQKKSEGKKAKPKKDGQKGKQQAQQPQAKSGNQQKKKQGGGNKNRNQRNKKKGNNPPKNENK